MPWKAVTASEQRQRFIEDYIQNYYSISDLADLSAKFEETRLTGAVWETASLPVVKKTIIPGGPASGHLSG